jgi:NAD(P)-dependent dehydrogenase (short-subunit alcohol dehydrogenase family)
MAGKKSGAVLVTGASTGIGRATALYLDGKGYRVFAGVRKEADANSLEEEGSERLTPVMIDVTNEPSITAAKRRISRSVGKDGLAALVNNAGVGGGGGPIEFMKLQDLYEALDVNLFGQVAVTQAYLPLLRKAQGTVVFVASIGGRVASPFMSPYNMSKFGVEALGESLRHEVKPWDIDVVVVEPGSIDTQIWEKGADTINRIFSKLPARAKKLYGDQMRRFGEVITETASRGSSPEKVAKVIYKAIRSHNPRPRYLVGADAKIAARLKGTVPERTFTKLQGRQMKLPGDAPSE